MTWQKKGTEFGDDCAEAGLSDAAYRTHDEAIGYIYGQENFALTVKKSTMRRWSGSDRAEQAATELVAKGFWKELRKREDDKVRAGKKRRGVGTDVGGDVVATQTDKQTGSLEGERVTEQGNWFASLPGRCSDCGHHIATQGHSADCKERKSA
jgi:hypothetical protein